MARISAGLDFGQAVVQPARTQPVDVGPGVAAVANSLERVGAQQQAEGQQLQRAQDAEARQAAQEAKVARDAAERGAAQAKMIAMRDSVSDELERIGQEVLEGRLPKTDATKAWQDRTAKILADNIEGVPEVHRATVQADLQALTGRLTSKVGDIVRKRDQTDTLAAITQVQEYTQRLAVTEPDKARQIWLDTVEQLGPFAGLQPDQIAKSKQGWIEGTAETRAITAINAAAGDNKALAVVEAGILKNSDLDPRKQTDLLAKIAHFRATNEAQALRKAQHAEIAAQRAQRQSDEAFGILQGWALQGKQADPAAAAGLISRLTPTAAAAYRSMAAEIPARTALAMQPVDVVRQRVADLTALSFKAASSGVEKELKRAQDILKAQEKAYDGKNDLSAGAQFGVIDSLVPIDMGSADGFFQSIGRRNDQAAAVETRVKRPVSRLTVEEAARAGDWISAMSPKAQGDFIVSAAKVMPRGALVALAGQIDDRNRPLALAMAAGSAVTTEGTSVAHAILRGARVLADKKDSGIGEKGNEERQRLRAEILEVVGTSLQGKNLQSVVDSAVLIKTGWDAEGGFKSSAELAVNLAIGGRILEHNGQRVPVPVGVDLPQALRNVSEKAIAAQTADGFVYLPGGRPMGIPEFLSALPEAQLEATAPGRYMVVIPGRGHVMGADRRAIVVGVQ